MSVFLMCFWSFWLGVTVCVFVGFLRKQKEDKKRDEKTFDLPVAPETMSGETTYKPINTGKPFLYHQG
jgi:hypothetical protein